MWWRGETVGRQLLIELRGASFSDCGIHRAEAVATYAQYHDTGGDDDELRNEHFEKRVRIACVHCETSAKKNADSQSRNDQGYRTLTCFPSRTCSR